ncbi:hypothetical protein SNEBB_007477 [Seison nebaliae]|nr:hypothetical protein SNEBB_007477 [Seison nebaliae]
MENEGYEKETELTNNQLRVDDRPTSVVDDNSSSKKFRWKNFVKKSNRQFSSLTHNQVRKNLGSICVAFFLLFSAFQALSNLQSSINNDSGLGTASLSTVYAGIVISCLLLPHTLINAFGLKKTLMLSQSAYLLYIMANFYPTWGTMIPSAALLGFGAAPLWTSKCSYLTEIAEQSAKLTDSEKESVVNRYFGIFFMAFQGTQVFGNLISSLVLKRKTSTDRLRDPIWTKEKCGANYLKKLTGDPIYEVSYSYNMTFPPEFLEHFRSKRSTQSDDDKPSMATLRLLVGIFLVCGVCSILTILFGLTDLKTGKERDKKDRKYFDLKLIASTGKHLVKNHKQKLLIPLTMYSGLEQAFLAGDFTSAFITCTRGVDYVGWVLICYGAFDSIASLLFGRLVKYIGRIPLFVLAAFLNCSVIIWLLLIEVTPKDFYYLFIVAGLWGISDAIWQAQINSLYGVLFSDNTEAAFSNYRLWESIGFSIAFGYSNAIKVRVKMYILLSVLIVAFILYSVVEFITRKEKKMKEESDQ